MIDITAKIASDFIYAQRRDQFKNILKEKDAKSIIRLKENSLRYFDASACEKLGFSSRQELSDFFDSVIKECTSIN